MSLPVTGQPVLGADLNRSERISTRPFDGPCNHTRGAGLEKYKVLDPGRAAAQMSFPSQFSESAAIPDV
jgi:hypothetical protein